MAAYYNEHDKYAAAWLRNLIAAGHIAPGDVDERSIEDVRPVELIGYEQCHFFAGIGVWNYALRRAGWPDSRPVWTGSCPCQPFSAAGKGGGFADERHLWPAWEWLIRHGKPRDVPVFGEQVASKPGLAWLDLVHADMERSGYAVGTVDLCAAGVGAPHIRQRLYFVADPERNTGGPGRTSAESRGSPTSTGARPSTESGRRGDVCRLADADGGNANAEGLQRGGQHGLEPQDRGADIVLGDAELAGFQEQRRIAGVSCGQAFTAAGKASERAGPPTFWSDADWLPCIDGKARPVEPGTFPLAHGIAGRVGRLRAYGNAIVAPCAKEFIRAYLEVLALRQLR